MSKLLNHFKIMLGCILLATVAIIPVSASNAPAQEGGLPIDAQPLDVCFVFELPGLFQVWEIRNPNPPLTDTNLYYSYSARNVVGEEQAFGVSIARPGRQYILTPPSYYIRVDTFLRDAFGVETPVGTTFAGVPPQPRCSS